MDNILNVTTIILGCLWLLFLWNIIPSIYEYYHRRKMINKIPGPPELPFFGSLFAVISLGNREKFQWFLRNIKKHKGGIFKIWINFQHFIHVYKPQYVQALLPSTVNIKKPYTYEVMLKWLGQGLISSSGEKWFHDRKLLTPTFHFNILEDFAVTMSEKAEVLLQSFEKTIASSPGKPIEIFQIVMKCTLDVICETAMGLNMHVQQSDLAEFPNAIRRLTDSGQIRIHNPWMSYDVIFYMTPSGKEWYSSMKKMYEFVDEIITKKKQIRRSQNDTTKTDEIDDLGRKKRKAFLDLLLDLNEKETQPLTDEDIRDQVITFAFAGHDTTGAAISWTLFAIGNNEDVQEKIHQELQEVFGDSKEPATIRELTELKYLDRVLKEGLRMYPPVPAFARELFEPVKCDDYIIPKGSNLMVHVYGLHHNPEIWPNPERFDPDRFLPENVKKQHPFAYVPFSAGPRNCIGQKFAQLEEKIILTAILRKWRIKSFERQDKIQFYSSIILRPSKGIFMSFTPKE